MNKIILLGRLVKDPIIHYSQSDTPVAIARYTLAVKRSYKRDGEQDTDFINIIAFGKRAEFVEKYFKKGLLVGVVGRLQIRSYTDQETGNKKWMSEVLTEEHHFAESLASFMSHRAIEGRVATTSNKDTTTNTQEGVSGFYELSQEDLEDDELPF